MKFLELFAGIGGFRRGLEELGHECVGWVEWDKFSRKSYMSIWLNSRSEWNAEDITKVTNDDIRDLTRRVGHINVLCFGSPCQDVSVAGRRAGFVKDGELTRSGLFFEAMRFAQLLRPDYLLMENVVGLLSSNEGRDMAAVICMFHEVGMEFVEWDVLNAKDFGIPQNRERVFIVGHLRGAGGRKVFPLRKDGSVDITSRKEKEQKTEIAQCIEATQYKGVSSERFYAVAARPVIDCARQKKTMNGRLIKNENDPMFTITAQDRHGVYDGYNIRKLTPLETWRLMGRQDWEFERAKQAGVSDSQLYKQAGNSLIPQIVTEIAKNFEN